MRVNEHKKRRQESGKITSQAREVNTECCRQEWLQDRMPFQGDGTVSVC